MINSFSMCRSRLVIRSCYGIGILFDRGALADVRDGKMRTTHAAAGSAPVVPFGARTLAEASDDLQSGLPEARQGVLRSRDCLRNCVDERILVVI